MTTEMKERVNCYVDLYHEITERLGDDEIACLGIVQEIAKDLRSDRIAQERSRQKHTSNDESPATEKQRDFLQHLGVTDLPPNLTKRAASALIDEHQQTT